MNGEFIFLTVIIVAASVLQIILFFKVWGMTNNVSKLTRFITNDNTEVEDATREALMGNYMQARTILLRQFINELLRLRAKCLIIPNEEYEDEKNTSEEYKEFNEKRNSFYAEEYEELSDRYQSLFDQLGITEKYDFSKLDTLDKVNKYFPEVEAL